MLLASVGSVCKCKGRVRVPEQLYEAKLWLSDVTGLEIGTGISKARGEYGSSQMVEACLHGFVVH